MDFNIPMNTSGAMGADSLMGLMNGGSSPQPQAYGQPAVQPQAPIQPQAYGQTPTQPQGYGQTTAQTQINTQTPVQSTPNMPIQPKQRPQGNGVILKKGQKQNLAKPGQTLTTIKVGLGWDIINRSCDLDASAFMLDANNKVIGDDWFVFYGQTVSPDGSVTHSGDSSGVGVGDDEVITMNLSAINPSVKKVVFVVTINEALERGLNFSMVANAYVRVVDNVTGNELIKFNLSDYYSNVTSMVVGEIYNHNGQWKFNAVGDGVARDLAGLCEMYGVNVAG